MMTPRQVFERLNAGIGSGDWSELHLLHAEDAEIEIPFLHPGPVRLHGRDQVREHFGRMSGRISLRPAGIRIHETTDPELIVAEFDYETANARLANIQVLRVRDGLIVESRDYHDHVAIAAALA